MCTGYTMELACGHQLVHRRTLCPHTCQVPRGPVEPVPDTCAPCHPSYRIQQLREEHERESDALATRAKAARRQGREYEAAKCEEDIEAVQRTLVLRIADARKGWAQCDPSVDVWWPGKTLDGL